MAKQKKSRFAWLGFLKSKWASLFGVILLTAIAIPATLILNQQSTDNHSHASASPCQAAHGTCVPKGVCNQGNGFNYCKGGYSDCEKYVGYVCGLAVLPTPTPVPDSGRGGSCTKGTIYAVKIQFDNTSSKILAHAFVSPNIHQVSGSILVTDTDKELTPQNQQVTNTFVSNVSCSNGLCQQSFALNKLSGMRKDHPYNITYTFGAKDPCGNVLHVKSTVPIDYTYAAAPSCPTVSTWKTANISIDPISCNYNSPKTLGFRVRIPNADPSNLSNGRIHYTVKFNSVYNTDNLWGGLSYRYYDITNFAGRPLSDILTVPVDAPYDYNIQPTPLLGFDNFEMDLTNFSFCPNIYNSNGYRQIPFTCH